MPKTLDEVTRDVRELSEIERLKLARIILDVCENAAQPSAEVEAAWDQEIENRLKDLRSGRVKGVSLGELQRSIESRFSSED